ncbi:hypothetical protein NKG05_13320 [Oerskovia sp. M15]
MAPELYVPWSRTCSSSARCAARTASRSSRYCRCRSSPSVASRSTRSSCAISWRTRSIVSGA